MIQNILVGIALIVALWVLAQKFGLLPKRKAASSKSCGQDDCGCH
ncbi:MAG: FeoB-associated Cys-rich membrane protein [Psychroserpens sp.]|nr:FeoB-associated Cys-rich membrane protein [Psychroserpens sp.]MBO6631588.1 FeoB-associated Cys-rich membrane protein [Psychroserpens sp.]MBO6653709.1 FeoB-associated Cys-rich membrane protein [Psychroserpens sp.]MBO6682030.1 FeoB-associated Cys-rich membrane protein [Psychroserpens sp.]MBO6748856.1 FeoB-associated Cys-rich membrane protein [Psychroserpens sp.]